ncbi:MAG: hypothetical protein LBP24_01650 [Coriobacteriales bacterium]|jgi:hypothetical protein|nr:hypothetical protein [Coriobacteriales bacterium]
MSEVLAQSFLDFFWVVLVSVSAGLLLLFVSLPLATDVTWTHKRLKFLGLFYNLRLREQLWLAVGMVRLLFVATVMFFWISLQPSHISFYLLLVLLSVVLFFRVRRAFMDVLNAAVIFVAMLVSNLVSGYYWDVSGDVMLWSVCMLLALFVTLYVAYFYLKDCCELLEHKQVGKKAARPASNGVTHD